jgi:hypothetical protein
MRTVSGLRSAISGVGLTLAALAMPASVATITLVSVEQEIAIGKQPMAHAQGTPKSPTRPLSTMFATSADASRAPRLGRSIRTRLSPIARHQCLRAAGWPV